MKAEAEPDMVKVSSETGEADAFLSDPNEEEDKGEEGQSVEVIQGPPHPTEEKINKIRTEGRKYRRQSPDHVAMVEDEIGIESGENEDSGGEKREKEEEAESVEKGGRLLDLDEEYGGDNPEMESGIRLTGQKVSIGEREEEEEVSSPESFPSDEEDAEPIRRRFPVNQDPADGQQVSASISITEQTTEHVKSASDDVQLMEVWPPPRPTTPPPDTGAEAVVLEEPTALVLPPPPPPPMPTTIEVNIMDASPSSHGSKDEPVAHREDSSSSSEDEEKIAEAAQEDLKQLMECMFAMSRVKGEEPTETMLKKRLDGKEEFPEISDGEMEAEEGPSWKPEGWPTPPREDELEEGEVREGYKTLVGEETQPEKVNPDTHPNMK